MKFPNFFKKKEAPKIQEEMGDANVPKPKKSAVKAVARLLFGNENDLRYKVNKELTPFEKQLGHPDWVSPVDRRPAIAPVKQFIPSKEMRIRFARERNLLDKPFRPERHQVYKNQPRRNNGIY